MSQETLVELEQGLDEDTLDAINETFGAEEEYSEFIQQERERRAQELERERQRQIEQAKQEQKEQLEAYKEKKESELESELTEKSLHVDANLGRYERRVKKVETCTNSNEFILTLTDREQNEITHALPIALPEDTGSKWVRLCDWVGVTPENPTHLRGEVIPYKISNSEGVDIPPVKGGLNPYAYKLKRAFQKIERNDTVQTAGHYIDITAPWWASALGVVIGMAGVLLLTIPRDMVGPVGEALLLIFVIPLAALASISAMYALKYWGGGALFLVFMVIVYVLKVFVKGCKALRPYLFPEK